MPPAKFTLTPNQLTEFNRLRGQLWAEAKGLVELHWPAIERVAEALTKSRLLSQDDVNALIANRAVLQYSEVQRRPLVPLGRRGRPCVRRGGARSSTGET
jgi:hypothetical protein